MVSSHGFMSGLVKLALLIFLCMRDTHEFATADLERPNANARFCCFECFYPKLLPRSFRTQSLLH